MKFNTIFKFFIALAISLSAGFVGAIFTTPAIQSGWYATLTKPALNPPNWIFGPVWTALYILMGLAAFLVWKYGLRRRDVKIALIVFDFQLVLNVFWSVIFFGSTSLTINGLNNIGIALIEIIFLWLSILVTIVLFAKISRPAAWLLFPYLLWVTFAVYLNYSIWILN